MRAIFVFFTLSLLGLPGLILAAWPSRLVATAEEDRLLTPTSYGIFHKRRRKMMALIKARTGIAALTFVAAAPLLDLTPSAFADDLLIIPTFGSSITGNANAAAIEGAINTAIATTEGLYSNSVTLPVTFTYNPDVPGNLGRSFETFFGVSYNQYITALRADLAANPQNTVLATALANLGSGNDANGQTALAVAGNQLTMLGFAGRPGNASINLNSNVANFAFSRPVPSNQFDAVGVLEHELNEVLGGGGAGSQPLMFIANGCVGSSGAFFCSKFGPTDLYRYSAPGTPSFSTSITEKSYLSVDGGATSIVSFNQDSRGDFGDFAGAGQLIQNAFNGPGQFEAYTTSSPEFAMMESIGWNPFPVPGPIVGDSATVETPHSKFGAQPLVLRRIHQLSVDGR